MQLPQLSSASLFLHRQKYHETSPTTSRPSNRYTPPSVPSTLFTSHQIECKTGQLGLASCTHWNGLERRRNSALREGAPVPEFVVPRRVVGVTWLKQDYLLREADVYDSSSNALRISIDNAESRHTNIMTCILSNKVTVFMFTAGKRIVFIFCSDFHPGCSCGYGSPATLCFYPRLWWPYSERIGED